MKKIKKIVLQLIFALCLPILANAQVDYLKESKLDYAKRMAWFREAKYGMFVHFGLYSTLGGEYKGKSIGGYAEWIQADANIPKEEYAQLIKSWSPVGFNADEIAQLAKDAGMKYIVLTTKHHEGFCLWDSPYTDFDIASSPMKGRDIVQELADACKKKGLKFGTYYSIIDWHHDSQNPNLSGTDTWGIWAQTAMLPEKKKEYIQYMKNQIKELIEKYDTDILWFDGDWVNWWDLKQGEELYQYIRTLKPNIIINNRVAKRKEFELDFGTPEQQHPKAILNYDWEACYTLNHSWGFKANDKKWKTAEEVNRKLHDINTKGGNLLLNIGPDGRGRVPVESSAILLKAAKLREKLK